MNYFESFPAAYLASQIRKYWSLSYSADAGTPTAEPVLPDGCAEIIFDLSDRFIQYHKSGLVEVQPRTIIAGQMTEKILIGPSGNTDLFGIKFHPAGAYSFLGLPLHEVTDVIIDARDILGAGESELFERMSETEQHEGRVKIFEDFFLRTSAKRKQMPLEFLSLIDSIEADPGSISIGELAGTIQWSERRVERYFKDLVGLSPKFFARIVRFQTFLKLIEEGGNARILDHSYSAGYYDQSHMIREFREFTGTTPLSFINSEHKISDLFVIGDG